MFFDLTKKQVQEYLQHVEDQTGDRFASAGTAADDERCPLACAYSFHHPGVEVSVSGNVAKVNGTVLACRIWQRNCVNEIDKLAAFIPLTQDVDVTVDYVRSLLEWV